MILNNFQRLMHGWSGLWPYNVGHVVTMEGAADLPRLRRAIVATLRETGLGVPAVRGDRAEFTPVDDVTIEIPGVHFYRAIRAEMNKPFWPGDLPVRFFVGERGGNHSLGVFFDHWIADSKSFGRLMYRILRRYQNPDAPALPPMTCDLPQFPGLFRTEPFFKTRSVATCIAEHIGARRAFRPGLGDPLDFRYGCFRCDAEPGLINRVHARSKEWGCTVNDIFLAVVAKLIGGRNADERAASHRNRIAVGAAVDLRRLAREPVEDRLGLLVSYFTVLVGSPETHALADLSRQVAASTIKSKEGRNLLRLSANMTMGLAAWRLVPNTSFRAATCHKMIPVTVAISNENYSGTWIDAALDAPGEVPRILDYFRVPPVGPIAPIILMPTTIRDRMSLTIGYRTTAFPHRFICWLGWRFMKLLRENA